MRARRIATALVGLAVALSLGCAMMQKSDDPSPNRADKTKKGAAIGAAAGAVIGAVVGEGEADEILAGAAIGAGIGAGIGIYMDKQEDRLAKIPNTTIERVSDDVVLIHMNSDVIFESNSARLTPSAQATLDEAARVMLDYPKTAIVAQGHSDDTGDPAFDRKLSERRAEAVRSYLISRGIDADRITAVGYGAEHAGEYVDNRRVDLLLKGKAA